tara:strand:+ start:278 stop:532 length:255 start_codon:yes stop_codon:yes gene_type:complete
VLTFIYFSWAKNGGKYFGQWWPHTVVLARPLKQQKQTKTLRRFSFNIVLRFNFISVGEYYQNHKKRQNDFKQLRYERGKNGYFV